MPDLEELRSATPWRRLAGRNRTKADIVVYRLAGGTTVALKDYSARGALVRNTIGRVLVRREARAYEVARGLTGIPELVGTVGPFALALTWIEARPLADVPAAEVPAAVFERLAAILGGLHRHGIALGDLHHRDVLLSEDGSVHVVDLATALVRGDSPGPLRRVLFERWREADLVALARLRARFTGGDRDEATEAVGGSAASWHRRGRRLKRAWDRLRGRRRGSGREL